MPITAARETAQRMKAPRALSHWIDTSAAAEPTIPDRVDWLRVLPFLGCTWPASACLSSACRRRRCGRRVALYALRMFAITGFYHRYFSHRAFRTSRALQFGFALLGAASVQRGPLWWAAHHRHHHRHADTERDVHAPRHGFWRSHVGWFLTARNFATDHAAVPDLGRYPELRWLDRFDIAVPVALAARRSPPSAPGSARPWHQRLRRCWSGASSCRPSCSSTPPSPSTRWRTASAAAATRPADDSRNNWLLALLTFGEGWHNNHHHFPGPRARAWPGGNWT
jgi:stearoyl-CoA desaturase (delta-9 desaturase)